MLRGTRRTNIARQASQGGSLSLVRSAVKPPKPLPRGLAARVSFGLNQLQEATVCRWCRGSELGISETIGVDHVPSLIGLSEVFAVDVRSDDRACAGAISFDQVVSFRFTQDEPLPVELHTFVANAVIA